MVMNIGDFVTRGTDALAEGSAERRAALEGMQDFPAHKMAPDGRILLGPDRVITEDLIARINSDLESMGSKSRWAVLCPEDDGPRLVRIRCTVARKLRELANGLGIPWGWRTWRPGDGP
jgi:hypothetical protein